MKLSELAETTGLPPRQIRYLMAEGIMPPCATGGGRYADGFNEEHLALAREYKRLLDAGMGVRAIKAKMAIDDETVLYRDDRFELRLRDVDALDGLTASRVRDVVKGVRKSIETAVSLRKGTIDARADEE